MWTTLCCTLSLALCALVLTSAPALYSLQRMLWWDCDSGLQARQFTVKPFTTFYVYHQYNEVTEVELNFNGIWVNKYFICLAQKHLREKHWQIVLSIIASCVGCGLKVTSLSSTQVNTRSERMVKRCFAAGWKRRCIAIVFIDGLKTVRCQR